MMGRHMIKSWSSTQASVALSSGEAEYYAGVKGAGVAISESSLNLDFVHVYDHQVSESDWINAAGIFARDAKKINISNSSIYNNDVQNGDGAGIGVFWSNELSLSNTTVYDNNAVGDNNCTAGGLIAQGMETVSVINSIFYDNDISL